MRTNILKWCLERRGQCGLWSGGEVRISNSPYTPSALERKGSPGPSEWGHGWGWGGGGGERVWSPGRSWD